MSFLRSFKRYSWQFWLGIALMPCVAAAADFSIVPLRVDLDQASRSAQVTIRNSGTEPLRMQMQAQAWTQDANGQDLYTDTNALMFFPRAVEVPAGESRVVRIAVRAAPVTIEDTYRLFFEEIPVDRPPAAGQAPARSGTSVRVLLRIGVPVFVAPRTSNVDIQLKSFDLVRGTARAQLVNGGSAALAADQPVWVGTGIDGKEILRTPIQNRYLLAGATRNLTVEIPAPTCSQLKTIELVFQDMAGHGVRQTIDVDPKMCR